MVSCGEMDPGDFKQDITKVTKKKLIMVSCGEMDPGDFKQDITKVTKKKLIMVSCGEMDPGDFKQDITMVTKKKLIMVSCGEVDPGDFKQDITKITKKKLIMVRCGEMDPGGWKRRKGEVEGGGGGWKTTAFEQVTLVTWKKLIMMNQGKGRWRVGRGGRRLEDNSVRTSDLGHLEEAHYDESGKGEVEGGERGVEVREKINQAYASLEVALRSQADGEEDTWGGTDPTGGSRPVSEELVVEATELQRRIEYCTSVRLKSTRSIKKSKEYRDVIYPQLFEYCLVVGLRLQTDGNGYEPYVLHKFPENVSSNLSVPSFCFPDASIFKPGSATNVSESYSFVMTYADGSRVYGYCRRIQPPDCSLPEVICIISPIDAFNMYNTLLSEIELRRRISSDLALEVIAASFGRPLPKSGKVCHIRTLDSTGEMETIFLNRPTDNRLDDVNYESPLFYLGTDRLVKVFSSMLMERRIILCSSNLSILTQTVHALSALLYPFHWQHVYVPLLPQEMLDVVCAPMPYILGVLSAFLPQVLQKDMEQVFIVDLDKKSIVKCQGDESSILPRKVQRALKTAINMCKIDSDAQNNQWLMVAEAFLRMFIETIGHFTSHVRTQQDGNRIFQKEGFILQMVSKELRQFLEWFTETQMFEVFIVDLVDKADIWDSNDLFMQRLKEHRDSKEENNRRKGLGAKVKNFGKALKTKLQS
ncbi:hypothetical protein RRG08_055865 [Elysia crispata]|uniref:UDENN domain-containing protein n=1 Tax=Elysia crispata TaxID=231223 RepID=A0AAE1DP61_9GAST|nr:hypothetical protein RRG08_055865 [Elysia crispata]